MGPKEKIERLAQTPEDRVLLARVWERGSGVTLACGTGACAAMAAAAVTGKVEECVTVHLLGGDLSIEWPEKKGEFYMSGPAAFVFEGTYPVDE